MNVIGYLLYDIGVACCNLMNKKRVKYCFKLIGVFLKDKSKWINEWETERVSVGGWVNERVI